LCVGLYGESGAIYSIFKRFEQNFCGPSIKIDFKSPISTLFLVKTTLKTEGKSFHSHEIRFNYTKNTLQTRSKVLNFLQNSIKIPLSDFKILFLNSILNSIFKNR